ncbi:hypothetical protein [Pantoea cypripedii]|nr:hypothetical protein [Pantoea cypripedii]
MMKILRKLSVVLILVVLLISTLIWGMGKTIDSRPEYRQSDFFRYHYFTDNQIQNTPRVSNDYSFRYRAQDGMVPLMSSIIFNGATDVMPLKKYIESLGYKYMGNDEGYGERWENERSNDVFLLWVSGDESKIVLTKEVYY